MTIANLRFGIPSLDAILIGKNEREVAACTGVPALGGILLSANSEGTSVCLIGPDGTGKSIFSMHLASQYLWDIRNAGIDKTARAPKIIYVSTDLRFDMAKRMFEDFQLDRSVADRGAREATGPIGLRKLPTGDASQLSDFLLTDSHRQIGFVDLASDSAGDDWALVTRIVSLLEDDAGPQHLLVVDAVEGLEALAADTDAFGQKVSRRARIAFLMRLASHKCHVVLVSEESKDGIRLPEQFVADIVIRLRSTLVNGYTRRTLEIEKARGQSHHARGQHPFQIRSSNRPKAPEPKAHITVYPSLHYQGNSVRERLRAANENQQAAPRGPDVVAFGIRHLDSLLKRGKSGRFGLHAGLPFAIVGDKGTLKSRLADSFLACCLGDIAQGFGEGFTHAQQAEWRKCWAGLAESAGVAVLCSSKPRDDLRESMVRQLLHANPQARRLLRASPGLRDRFKEHMCRHMGDRVVFDPLVIQDQPGPRLFHRTEGLMHQAKSVLNAIPGLAGQNQRIWLVFDDMSGFRDAYPELHADPLLPASHHSACPAGKHLDSGGGHSAGSEWNCSV